MFSLSGPHELFFYCLLNLSCGECDVISLYFMCCSVNGSVCLIFDLAGNTFCHVRRLGIQHLLHKVGSKMILAC